MQFDHQINSMNITHKKKEGEIPRQNPARHMRMKQFAGQRTQFIALAEFRKSYYDER